MKIFRHKTIQKFFILVGGIAFFNLNLVLIEVKLLNISNNTLIENLAKFGFDEEKADGESGETETSVKEVDLSLSLISQHVNHLVCVAEKNIQHYFDAALDSGFKLIFSPPPEFLNNLA